jgi:hypothetical protein
VYENKKIIVIVMAKSVDELRRKMEILYSKRNEINEEIITLEREINNCEYSASDYEWVINKWFDISEDETPITFNDMVVAEYYVFFKPLEIYSVDENDVILRGKQISYHSFKGGGNKLSVETYTQKVAHKDKFRKIFKKECREALNVYERMVEKINKELK